MSRADVRLRAPRLTAVPGLLVLLMLAGAPAVAQQPCFPDCDPMNPIAEECCPASLVDAPCNTFLTCQEENRTGVNACVERFCMGRGALGQCTRALACSRECAADTVNCSKNLRSSLQTAGACSIGRGAARRACNRCFEKTPPVCGELAADTTGSSCQKQCIRDQPWIKECFQKCADRCANDRCAIAVCHRGCRDSICTILQNTCSPDAGVPGNPDQQRLQLAYARCCDRSGGCEEDSSDSIVCESTSTTSTSTSSTLQTTSTSVRATTTTSTLVPR